MILTQISYLDCIAFLIFLTPQLLIHVGLLDTAACGLKALPFLLVQMPFQFIWERYLTPRSRKSPFVQRATPFQDIVIRCVRYAFADIPASIGKVFFSEGVALPFFYFRMWRHGIFNCPIPWVEIDRPGLKGLWIISDETKVPDVVVYYCHGGGFSMGSSYFYLEFLLAWVSLLKTAGYANPALFALEYTLVPEASFPTQVREAQAGYEYVLSRVSSPSRVCLAGDSAGATLQLSLLLHLARDRRAHRRVRIPGLAVMISPWTTIESDRNRDTASDYLNAETLQLYGSQYVGPKASAADPMVSPGVCRDSGWWTRASPLRGWYFVFGGEEVFAGETRSLAGFLRKQSAAEVLVREEEGWVHAWPVVKLFLSSGEDRVSGLRGIVKVMRERM